ncbi:MAG TPA: protein kinase, partial [Salinarimonas sp.]|nr:protein kinase [Salinarimonas sp.]
KDELLDTVWPGLAVVDSSLATAISKLRKALNDDGVIVTVPRVGYRLAVQVQRRAFSPPVWPELHFTQGEPVPGRDQWRLARRLDLSPSSEVWLAEHGKTHESRVFKFAPDDARLRSLKREVTLARLFRESLGERPEFVRILEWNFTSQPYFLESEYVGPNLAEWAECQGGLHGIPLERRLELLADVARAVANAHDLDVLHKDLKPGNILVAKRPDGKPQIKIADFGSAALLVTARLAALGITGLGFTQAGTAEGGTLTGTVLYVAPEVIAGQSPTAAADVYALGVLLYQLTIGDFRKPLAPGWENDIPDPLIREDIASAASGDPARRLQSAAEFANRLLDLDRRRIERKQREHAQQQAAIGARNRAEARARLPWLVVAGLVLVVTVSVLGIYSRSRSAPPRLKTVAVLPFQNVGSDASIDFLRLSLPDEIATILSRTRGLAVRPSGTTSQYEQPGVDAQRAGRELHVDRIVTGHFVRAGAQLHITLEAIDVESNRAVWRDKIEAPAESMIATQMQLALRVQRSLVPSFGVSAASSTAQPKDEEAYNLFLRSAALKFDASNNAEALELLERAVKLDPSYPPAWHALARRYYGESRYASGNSAMMERWRWALGRVLALDPDYVPASAGLIRGHLEQGNLFESYRNAEDLVRKHPDSVDAHFTLSYVLRYAGLLQESASHCETAFLLDARTQTSGLRSCAIAFIQLA